MGFVRLIYWDVLVRVNQNNFSCKGTKSQGLLIKTAFIIVITTLLLFVLLAFFTRPGLLIVDTPIRFSQERTQATLEYIQDHYEMNTTTIDIDPKMIVLHWTETATIEEAFALFNREQFDENNTMVSQAGHVNVSAHFLIDAKGHIYRLMPETKMARHVIGLNYHAIGIENVGGVDAQDTMTPQQLQANIDLVHHLKDRFPKITYLIGHYEYTRFEDHPLWMERDAAYRTIKTDPSAAFVQAVYEGTKSLGLLRAP